MFQKLPEFGKRGRAPERDEVKEAVAAPFDEGKMWDYKRMAKRDSWEDLLTQRESIRAFQKVGHGTKEDEDQLKVLERAIAERYARPRRGRE